MYSCLLFNFIVFIYLFIIYLLKSWKNLVFFITGIKLIVHAMTGTIMVTISNYVVIK